MYTVVLTAPRMPPTFDRPALPRNEAEGGRAESEVEEVQRIDRGREAFRPRRQSKMNSAGSMNSRP